MDLGSQDDKDALLLPVTSIVANLEVDAIWENDIV